MKINSVYQFLRTVPRYKESTDGTQCSVECPFCGDSTKNKSHGHLNIKINVKTHEPMVMQCFRADCGYKGLLTTEVLQKLGCSDMSTIIDLANHNKGISKSLEKGFVPKVRRDLEMINLDIKPNLEKIKYINQRLGVNLKPHNLRKLKIQLGLYEFINLNNIRSLAFPRKFCDVLDANTIGFMSMYNDYLICRDISSQMVTGKRYHNYRIMGKADIHDMKIYCIPTEIDILNPEPATIHIAEGPFSILGAYLHIKHKPYDTPNTIWLANCGAEYDNSIMHICKQYGLLHVNIHIWSDSEIKISKYEQTVKRLSQRITLRSFYVHYNSLSDDFGHPANMIRPESICLQD